MTLQNKEQGAGEEATVKMPPRFLPCRQMTVPREDEQVFGRGKGGFHLGHAEAEMLRNPRWVFSAGNERSIPEARERVPDEKVNVELVNKKVVAGAMHADEIFHRGCTQSEKKCKPQDIPHV